MLNSVYLTTYDEDDAIHINNDKLFKEGGCRFQNFGNGEFRNTRGKESQELFCKHNTNYIKKLENNRKTDTLSKNVIKIPKLKECNNIEFKIKIDNDNPNNSQETENYQNW